MTMHNNNKNLETDSFDRKVDKAINCIANECDGPLTAYVLIANAIRVAHRVEVGGDPEPVIEALYQMLIERGLLKDDTIPAWTLNNSDH